MEGHGAGLWFYFPVLLLGFFPWSVLLPVALRRAFNSWRELRQSLTIHRDSPDMKETVAARDELEWFAALWIVGVFVFFTLSSTRLPHYIGPLFPAAAVLTALYWSQCLKDPLTKGFRGSIHVMMGVGYLLAIGLACLPTVYGKFSGKLVKEFPLAAQFDIGSGPYFAAVVLLFGMGMLGYFGLNDERRGAAFGVAGGMVASVVLLAILTVIPGINRYAIAPPQELAYAAGLNLSPTDQFIAYGSTRPSMVFYARRNVVFISSGEVDRLRAALTYPGRTMILLPERVQDTLPREAASFQPILKRYGYVLLASQPMVTLPESAIAPPTTPPKIVGH
jgi:hypothetical protein